MEIQAVLSDGHGFGLLNPSPPAAARHPPSLIDLVNALGHPRCQAKSCSQKSQLAPSHYGLPYCGRMCTHVFGSAQNRAKHSAQVRAAISVRRRTISPSNVDDARCRPRQLKNVNNEQQPGKGMEKPKSTPIGPDRLDFHTVRENFKKPGLQQQNFSMSVTVPVSNPNTLAYSSPGNTLVTASLAASTSLTDTGMLSPPQASLHRNVVSPGVSQRPPSTGNAGSEVVTGDFLFSGVMLCSSDISVPNGAGASPVGNGFVNPRASPSLLGPSGGNGLGKVMPTKSPPPPGGNLGINRKPDLRVVIPPSSKGMMPPLNTQRISSSQSTQPLATPVVSVTTPSLATQGLVYSAMPTTYNTVIPRLSLISPVLSGAKVHDQYSLVLKVHDQYSLVLKVHDQYSLVLKVHDQYSLVLKVHDQYSLVLKVHDQYSLVLKVHDQYSLVLKVHDQYSLVLKVHNQYSLVLKVHNQYSLVLKVHDQYSLVLKVHDQYSLVLKVHDQYSLVLKVHDQYSLVLKAQDQYSLVLKAQDQYSLVLKAHDQYSLALKAHDQYSLVLKAHDQYSLVLKAHDQYSPVLKAHGQYSPILKAHDQYSLFLKAHDQYFLVLKVLDQSEEPSAADPSFIL
ncbi:unnamed protein product [Ranitomeya imitator]|uniref:Uncharacterized protein n=1 Tax=Ranitomeya imitator TaxID=111125 RepID=A0ABN9LN50_9NEOB|nr:unnamed protein product [Ranitomeya imitator]